MDPGLVLQETLRAMCDTTDSFGPDDLSSLVKAFYYASSPDDNIKNDWNDVNVATKIPLLNFNQADCQAAQDVLDPLWFVVKKYLNDTQQADLGDLKRSGDWTCQTNAQDIAGYAIANARGATAIVNELAVAKPLPTEPTE